MRSASCGLATFTVPSFSVFFSHTRQVWWSVMLPSALSTKRGCPDSWHAVRFALILSSVCCVAWSPVVGHDPPASACVHFVAYFSSHFAKSGAAPVFTALASAFSRQNSYFPATFSLLASHFSAASSADAVVANMLSASTHTVTVTLISPPRFAD